MESQDKSSMYVPMFKIEASFDAKLCFKIHSKADHGAIGFWNKIAYDFNPMKSKTFGKLWYLCFHSVQNNSSVLVFAGQRVCINLRALILWH